VNILFRQWLAVLFNLNIGSPQYAVANDGRLRDHASRNMRSNARTDGAATPALCATLLNFMQ